MDTCLATYLSLCQPYQPPPQWRFVAVDPGALQGPALPEAAWQTLCQQHPTARLAASGVGEIRGGKVHLHPLLSQPSMPLVAVQDHKTGEICDLVTDRGCLLSRSWPPAFKLLEDSHTLALLRGTEHRLLVAADLCDVILLRALGLAAAPPAQLHLLNAAGLDLLQKHFGLGCRKSQRQLPPHEIGPGIRKEGSDNPGRLVFVRGCLHAVSTAESVALGEALKAFDDYHRFLGLMIDRAERWKPSDQDLAFISFALARRELCWLKTAVLDSLRSSCAPIPTKWSQGSSAASRVGLASVTADLQAMLRTGRDATGRTYQEVSRRYHETVNEQITGPLLQRSEQVTDPVEQSLQFQFAHFNALFLDQMPYVRQQLAQGKTVPSQTSAGSDKSFSDLLATSRHLIALGKELSK